jgi:regulator of replication initiation timing
MLGGRGGQQTELMRIVDARDIALPFTMQREATRVQVQVPHPATPPAAAAPAPTRDAKWTVGTDRDLPVDLKGAWDGDKAAASVLDWAGFRDGETPDPAKARRAFLIYDADAPDLRGSYKLPIAEYRSGANAGLHVVKSGMDAAASYLPQTDAPQEVLDRARAVLDHYYKKIKQPGAGASRDKGARKMKIVNVEVGIGRDNFNKLVKSGLAAKLANKGRSIPQTLIVPVPVSDEMDPKELIAKLEEIKTVAGDLIEMAGEAMGDAEGAVKEAEDAEAMKARCAEMETAIAEKEKELAAMKEQMAAAAKTSDALRIERDSLRAEVEPLRAKEVDELRAVAVQLGCAEDKVKAAKDAAEIRRMVASAKLGERYSETTGEGEAKTFKVADSIVAGVYEGLIAGLQSQSNAGAGNGSSAGADPIRDYAAPFAAIPQLTPHAGGQAKPKVKREQDEEIDPFTAGLMAAGG